MLKSSALGTEEAIREAASRQLLWSELRIVEAGVGAVVDEAERAVDPRRRSPSKAPSISSMLEATRLAPARVHLHPRLLHRHLARRLAALEVARAHTLRSSLLPRLLLNAPIILTRPGQLRQHEHRTWRDRI